MFLSWPSSTLYAPFMDLLILAFMSLERLSISSKLLTPNCCNTLSSPLPNLFIPSAVVPRVPSIASSSAPTLPAAVNIRGSSAPADPSMRALALVRLFTMVLISSCTSNFCDDATNCIMFLADCAVRFPVFLRFFTRSLLPSTARFMASPVSPVFLATVRIPRPIAANWFSDAPPACTNSWNVSWREPASRPNCFSAFSCVLVRLTACLRSLTPLRRALR